MNDPLKPSVTLLTKLGSALVHAAEATEPGGHPFDVDALRGLLADDEVVEWVAGMDRLALLPKKRSRRVRPAAAPCRSCPYRQDVPSGVWAREEYEKLPAYDGETAFQPVGLFMCHQQDGNLCAGWVGCHDMQESLAVRIGLATGALDDADADALFDYESPVALFASGEAAAAHGLAQITQPDGKAVETIQRLERKQKRGRGR